MAAVEDDSLLTRLTPSAAAAVPICVHGTRATLWPAIRAQGLLRMSRNHVHFASGLPEEGSVVSGMRGSAQVLVYVDVERAVNDGVPFFVSENGVYLSPGVNWGGFVGVVPPQYFLRVVDRATGNSLLLGA
jgi:RNA:NAD 2'-phosphotransferase (TPT1/KptA family)